MNMTIDEIRAESRTLFNQQKAISAHVSETTPVNIASLLVDFASTLTSCPPRFVDVVDDPDGLFGWCSDGVAEKVKTAGGSPVFGWCIWEWAGVMWTAEFHCVWKSAAGELVDITPKPQGETQIVFAPDENIPPDFDFDTRPGNRRQRSRQQVDTLAVAREKLGNLKPGQLSYETARAARAGIPVEQWMAVKVPLDPVVELIDRAIAATEAEETERDRLGAGGGTFVASSTYLSAAKAKHEVLMALKSALK
jgi:hypothetical protein